MKILIIILLFPIIVFGQDNYKGLPLIKAEKNFADFKIGGYLITGKWRISPEYSPDVLDIPCLNGKTEVTFYTDLDSIKYIVESGKSYRFYILLNGKDYALTELKGTQYEKIEFDNSSQEPQYSFLFSDPQKSDYLQQLKNEYHLEELVKHTKTEIEKVSIILNWVHNQWAHDGNNQPEKSDALSILNEVKSGKNFRCVEYGIVTSGCLNSLGLKSRLLALKTKDVETKESGAGHVLSEVYLNDFQKWVMLDGQFDAIPFLDETPLNAVEFQNAIVTDYADIEIKSISGISKREYVSWIYPYLYYFSVSFDSREGIDEKQKINGKSNIMLVPTGAKEPTVFQIKHPIDYCIYTNSLNDFYVKPDTE